MPDKNKISERKFWKPLWETKGKTGPGIRLTRFRFDACKGLPKAGVEPTTFALRMRGNPRQSNINQLL
jgi:hypothetical protein